MKRPSALADACRLLRLAGDADGAAALERYVDHLEVQLRDRQEPGSPIPMTPPAWCNPWRATPAGTRQEGRQRDRQGRFKCSPPPGVTTPPAPPLVGPVVFECLPRGTWRLEHDGRAVDFSCRQSDAGLAWQVLPTLALMAASGGETWHRFAPELGHALATAINVFLKRRIRPHWPDLADALHVTYRKVHRRVRFNRRPLPQIIVRQPDLGDVVILP